MTTNERPELLWNVDQIRAALGNCSKATVWRLFEAKAFAKVKLGQKVYAYVDDVRAYVSRCAEQSGRAAA